MAEELQQQDSQEQLETPTSNKRIAKNALMLYIRMFLAMIVGLYTSRVVLATLGVEDYGIYGVVGGVVAMMGFLNASMSGATSRFLTFELGRGDQKRLAETFSSALIVHIGIALIVFVLAETVGLWFLCNKLVIPAGRMNAAHWVYQCSILSAMLGITQAPYNASIIAHEKMDVYAYVEILNVSLKLLIVYLLVIGNFDKLKLYAVLVLAVSVLIMLIYRIYCIRKFKETHFHWIWKNDYLKPMLSFSGWDLYGNGCVTARQQGVNFLINMFFGVVYNAASSLASMVNGLMISLSSNMIQAFRPVIIKDYAKNDITEMQKHMNSAFSYMVLMFGCLFIPIFLELNYLFELWLISVPKHAVVFCRLLLLAAIFRLLTHIINISIHATGKIRLLSFTSGSILLVSLPLVYIFFRCAYNAEVAYILDIIINISVFICSLVIMKKLIPALKVSQMILAVLKSISLLAIAAIECLTIYILLDDGLTRVLCIMLADIISVGLLTYAFIIDQPTRDLVRIKLHLKK